MNHVKVGVIAICLTAVSSQFAVVGLCEEDESLRASSAQDRFAGFPKLSMPGKRTAEVLTSDGVEGLVRPKWTRAMGDVGAWPAMFRFGKRVFLYFPKVRGHRGPYRNNNLPIVRLVSDDEGRRAGRSCLLRPVDRPANSSSWAIRSIATTSTI